MYTMDRDKLAQMVAANACGIEDAIAEQADFDIADKIITMVENEMRK